MALVEPTTSDKELAITSIGSAEPSKLRTSLKMVVTLFKLRIVLLLLFSAFGGAALGLVAGGEAGAGQLWILALTGTLSAAGASALNQYLERDRDRQMGRTSKRPLPAGEIDRPERILAIAMIMIFGASIIAWAANMPDLAFWLFAGAAIYVGVYTVWLKPRTSLNIVIGGAAGSCAVISGGAAVGMQWSPAVWIMGGLVFAWTPVHFWALALAYRADYQRSPYPMLPGLVSPKTSARWIAIHTVVTIGLAIAMGLIPQIDMIMLIAMGLISLPLIYYTVGLLIRPDRESAFALFHTSNLFLAAVIMAAILSPLWR